MAYDWKITAKKFGLILVEVLIAGAIAYFTGRQEFIGLVPLFEAARNWFKHRND